MASCTEHAEVHLGELICCGNVVQVVMCAERCKEASGDQVTNIRIIKIGTCTIQ